MAFYGDKRPKKDFVRRNDMIRVPQVRLVENGQNLGIMATSLALARARTAGLDLVEVAPQAKPPVCHIMDYGKFMFEKQKKEKDKLQSQSQVKEKKICIRYVIDEHDLEVKADQCRRFLEEEHRVQVVVKFKERENAHKDKGFDAINKFLSMVQDVAVVEKQPAFEGSNITARLQAKKEKADTPLQ